MAWIALFNANDALYTRAQSVMGDLRLRNVMLVTTEFALLELADAFCAPSVRAQTVVNINGLRRMAVLHIVPVSSELLARGWTLYSRRPDKEWGLTGCTSFVVMQEEDITAAFTSDHHFEQAGSVKLL